MPTYDYRCECGHQFERQFPMSGIKQRVKCPACGKMAKKAISRPNAIVRHRYADVAADSIKQYMRDQQENPRAGRGRGY